MLPRALTVLVLAVLATPVPVGAGSGLVDLAGRLDLLAHRLALTAHAAEGPERVAIAALARLADEAREVARDEQDRNPRLDPGAAAARLRAAADEVDRAIDAAGPYETLRAEWERLRDQALAPTVEALATAAPAAS
jgi:hypothetical protein